MKFEVFKNSTIRHFHNNLWLYVLSSVCMCTGVVLGVYTVKYMSSFERNDLLGYLTSFAKNDGLKSINYNQVLLESIKNNIPLIAIVWFLGLTMIGIPIILVIDALKGFTVGFTVTFFVNGLGIKGVWMALLSIIPQNIIYIPCIMITSVLAMEFSFMLIRDNVKKNWTKNVSSKIFSYTLVFVMLSVLMFTGFFFETYLTPSIIRAMS
ncbi:stage II sporulation protein M [Clostridium akagii]|uniref:stage II sporulation protein M n=1 Tax=Clostridium akagii TaxID=91623 RepID=UPI000478C401|nr:stage II sporulation protein M [Clostridium akagii]